MKKVLFVINILFTIFAYAENRAVMLGHDDKDSHIWLYLSQESKNDDLEIQIKNDDNINCYITKSNLNKILQACKEDKFISFENIYNGNFELENKYQYHYYVYLDEILDNLTQQVWYDTDDYSPYAINTLYNDDEIGLSKFYFENAKGVLYSKNDGQDVPIGYYNEDGQVKSCWQYFYGEDVIEQYQEEVSYENGEKINLEGGILINIPANTSAIVIPQIIDFNTLENVMTSRLGNLYCLIAGGFCALLVIKKGIKWFKYVDYKNKAKTRNNFNRNYDFVNKKQYLRNQENFVLMPFVKKDEFGDYYDSLHDEHYQAIGFNYNYYVNMRKSTLYLKYMNKYDEMLEDYKNGLDVFSEEKKTLYANGKIRKLNESEFYQVLKNKNINVATVEDDDFLGDVILTDTNTLINNNTETKTYTRRKSYYSKNKYWAKRNNYKKKGINNSSVSSDENITSASDVPLDDGYVSHEENMKIQSEWYEKNKDWIAKHQSPIREKNMSVAEMIEEREKMKEELKGDSSPYYHLPVSEN